MKDFWLPQKRFLIFFLNAVTKISVWDTFLLVTVRLPKNASITFLKPLRLLVVANIGLQPVMHLPKLVQKHILTLLIRYMKSPKV